MRLIQKKMQSKHGTRGQKVRANNERYNVWII